MIKYNILKGVEEAMLKKAIQVGTLDFTNSIKLLCTKKTNTLDYTGKEESNRYIDKGDIVEVGIVDENILIPVNYPTSKGNRIAYLKNLNNFTTGITIYNQYDYPNIPYPAPGYENATIRTSGCGVCCAAMVVSNLVKPVSVQEMTNLAINSGARVSGGTSMNILSKQLVSKYGLIFSTTNSIEKVKEHLLQGGLVIANCDGDKGAKGIFSSGGHYIVLYKYQDDIVTVLDSGYTANKYQSDYRKQYVSESGIRSMVFTTSDAVALDCKEIRTRYYLYSV